MATSTKILICCAIALAFVAMASGSMDPIPDDLSFIDEMARNEEVAHRLKMAIKAAKQIESGPIQQSVRTNFLNTLYLMANASAVAGTDVSRAAGTIIRGFVQDSFNLGSIGAYLPRLIFLDGPTQFIEVLRLVRTNQIRVPTDIDSAMDTLINFATQVRDAPTTTNISNPFLAFFPNIFRGSEKLAGDVLFNVFAWLSPLSPGDVSLPALQGLENRWDQKSTTTVKPRVA